MEKNMTLEQIETLVEAYFECKLSRGEEAELRQLLASVTYHSEPIDSCRLEMGIETAMRKSRTGKTRLPLRHWLSIAASVALVAGICATILIHNNSALTPRESTIVYIAGKKVKDYSYAKKLVEQSQAESMAQIYEMLNEANAEKHDYDVIMNEMLNNK